MIKFHEKLPDFFYLAVSGGKDSMTILNFLANWNKNEFSILHINHGTEYGNLAEQFLHQTLEFEYADFICQYRNIEGAPKKNEPVEAFWSRKRNEIFQQMNWPVITAHHLNDAVEWWVYSSMKGNPSLMNSRNNNIIRPFITTSKESIDYWCKSRQVKYLEDPTNENTDYTRNYIRHEMMDHVLRVNPGIFKTVRKKYINADK